MIYWISALLFYLTAAIVASAMGIDELTCAVLLGLFLAGQACMMHALMRRNREEV